MRELLERKLASNWISYRDQEVAWLLEHLGDESPEIRDGLAYASLAQAISQHRLNRKQMRFLIVELQNPRFLNSSHVVMRSFASLLVAIIIRVDGDPDSPWFGILEKEERFYFFQKAIEILQFEEDWQAYDNEIGWIHAHAHEADLLTEVGCHPLFPREHWSSIFACLSDVFQDIPRRPRAGEEWRLARVIHQALLKKCLSQSQVESWLVTCQFPMITPLDLERYETFCSFLMAIYVQLNKERILSKSLKKRIEDFILY